MLFYSAHMRSFVCCSVYVCAHIHLCVCAFMCGRERGRREREGGKKRGRGGRGRRREGEREERGGERKGVYTYATVHMYRLEDNLRRLLPSMLFETKSLCCLPLHTERWLAHELLGFCLSLSPISP